MAVTLRPYQEKSVHEVRVAMRDGHKNVLLQMPTGAGKTITSGFIMGSAADRGNDGIFICNRVELLAQTGKAFDRLGIRHSYIAPEFRPDYSSRVQVASIDTLKVRIRKGLVKPPKMVVWDECRSLGAKGWTDVFKWFQDQGTLQIGLDATPIRLDGKPMADYFSHLVHGPSYSELQALGALVPFDCYGPKGVDLTGIRTKGHDYDHDQVEEAVDKPQLVGDVVDHYLQHARGKLGITFAVSRKHSIHLAEAYNAAGIPAAHVDGDSDPHFRREAVKRFRRRELLQLCNVDLFTAGFDVPGVECISDVAPTQSLSKALQKWGRGSRPDEENPAKLSCVLLDHAGNWERHGLPDMDRTWSLEGRPRGAAAKKKEQQEAAVLVRQCEDCMHVHPPRPTCPKCGFVYPIQSRTIEQVEGELKKLTKEEVAARKDQQKREVKGARTLDDLKRIEAERGYSPGWAEKTFSARHNARERIMDRIAQQQFEAYRR